MREPSNHVDAYLRSRRKFLEGLWWGAVGIAAAAARTARATELVASPALRVTAEQRRSATSILRHLAQDTPCAATGLAHILEAETNWQDGVLYLDQRPSRERIEFMLGAFERGAPDASFLAAQRNPYSGSALIVELRWSTRRSGESMLVQFRAQLARRVGAELTPPHLVEGTAGVLVSADRVRLPGGAFSGGALANGKQLSVGMTDA